MTTPEEDPTPAAPVQVLADVDAVAGEIAGMEERLQELEALLHPTTPIPQ